jgi:CRP-like cAMP-binding protein
MSVASVLKRQGAVLERRPPTDSLAERRALLGLVFPNRTDLVRYVDEVEVAPDTVLAREGHSCQQLVIVAAGRLRATSCDGRVRILRSGEAFGLQAMREWGANDANLIAETPARVLVMSRAQFRAV